jgi:hypothetical protein
MEESGNGDTSSASMDDMPLFIEVIDTARKLGRLFPQYLPSIRKNWDEIVSQILTQLQKNPRANDEEILAAFVKNHPELLKDQCMEACNGDKEEIVPVVVLSPNNPGAVEKKVKGKTSKVKSSKKMNKKKVSKDSSLEKDEKVSKDSSLEKDEKKVPKDNSLERDSSMASQAKEEPRKKTTAKPLAAPKANEQNSKQLQNSPDLGEINRYAIGVAKDLDGILNFFCIISIFYIFYKPRIR